MELDPEQMKLLVWLTAENSYWNNVALWLEARKCWDYEQCFGVPITASPEEAFKSYQRKHGLPVVLT